MGADMRAEPEADKGPKRGERGSTLVEFALVLPMFLLFLFGIMEFGRYFFVQHTMQFATREGTRLALVGGTLVDEQGNTMTRVDSIVQMIEDNARLAINPSEIAISIFPITAGYTDPTGWEAQQNAGQPGDYMRVRTRHTYRFIVPLIGSLFPGGISLIQAEATYRNELF